MDVNPIRLIEFAKIASERFLANGVTLNQAIAKIAEEHELNPMQIRRVVEYANHDSNLQLLKSSEDKNFTFELADADKIIQMVRGGGGMAKVAAAQVLEAVDTKPPGIYPNTDLLTKMARDTTPEKMVCLERNITALMEKLAAHARKFSRDTRSEVMGIREGIEESLQKIASMAKDHIVMNQGRLSDLFKFACIKDPDWAPVFLKVFGHIKDDMMKLGAPVDKSLIADQLEMPDGTLEIINGAHTLAIELDTMKNKINEEDKATHRLRLLDTFGDAVVDRIQTLRTPEDMNEYLEEDLAYMNKQAEAGIGAFVEAIEKEALSLKAKALLALLPVFGYTGYAGGKAVEEATREAIKGLSMSPRSWAGPYSERGRVRSLTLD